MPETVLERHYRDRLLSVQQLAVHEGGRAALAGWDFEDLVTLCLELSTSGQQLVEREYKRIFKVPNLTVAWLQERRQGIEELTALLSWYQRLAGDAASRQVRWREFLVGDDPHEEAVHRGDWPVGAERFRRRMQRSGARPGRRRGRPRKPPPGQEGLFAEFDAEEQDT